MKQHINVVCTYNLLLCTHTYYTVFSLQLVDVLKDNLGALSTNSSRLDQKLKSTYVYIVAVFYSENILLQGLD